MEPIGEGPEGPPVQELQLCPACYLVTWRDHDGPHIQQGIPMPAPKGGGSASMEPPAGLSAWPIRDPEEC